MGEATNNEAEYLGLLAVLENVQACGHGRVNIQMDSMLAVMQIRWEFACRSPTLDPLYTRANRMLQSLEAAGAQIVVEHVYREFNAVADSLANKAVDSASTCPRHRS